MDFLKIKDTWTYQIPEWDDYSRGDIEDSLEDIEGLVIDGYMFDDDSESDIWYILYQNCEFLIVNDLTHGCAVKTTNEEDLPVLGQLVGQLDF